MKISYGIHTSPFGPCLIGTTVEGICQVTFMDKESDVAARRLLKKEWPDALLIKGDKKTGALARRIFYKNPKKNFDLMLRGTDFQIAVWKELLRIPKGKTSTYAAIAKKIGKPKAVRAVGTACGKNPIAYLVPCHRVLASNGSLGGYRWGLKRKSKLLKQEAL